MYKRSVMIVNKSGLHARPATDFVTLAKSFRAKVNIAREENPEEKANAKSIITLLTMALTMHTPVVISADGEDEREAVDALCAQIEAGFGEGE